MKNQSIQMYSKQDMPYDSQGYVLSFDVHTATNQQLFNFYHRFGFLIFKNVINQSQISKTIDDLWSNTTSYYKQMRNVTIDRNNPQTWGQLRGFQKAYGFVNDGILQEPQIWENRKNPNVYEAFKRAYEANLGINQKIQQPLIASFDRGSLMLPSKINSQWRTDNIYHFDIDPWLWCQFKQNHYNKYDYDAERMSLLLGEGNYQPYRGYTKFAGVLALSNTNQTSGGFQCACGFQNYIKKWCIANQYYTSIVKDKNLLKCFKKIFMRKGSLLVFSRELPHNIYQNDSQNIRYAQYLRMSPLSTFCLTPQLYNARKQLIKMILPKSMKVQDKISRQIFMLDEDTQINLDSKSKKIQQRILDWQEQSKKMNQDKIIKQQKQDQNQEIMGMGMGMGTNTNKSIQNKQSNGKLSKYMKCSTQ